MGAGVDRLEVAQLPERRGHEVGGVTRFWSEYPLRVKGSRQRSAARKWSSTRTQPAFARGRGGSGVLRSFSAQHRGGREEGGRRAPCRAVRRRDGALAGERLLPREAGSRGADQEASGIPYTIVHPTQFFEFLGGIVKASNGGQEVRLSPAPIQPIASTTWSPPWQTSCEGGRPTPSSRWRVPSGSDSQSPLSDS